MQYTRQLNETVWAWHMPRRIRNTRRKISSPGYCPWWALSSVGGISGLQIFIKYHASTIDYSKGEDYVTAKAEFAGVKIGNRYQIFQWLAYFNCTYVYRIKDVLLNQVDIRAKFEVGDEYIQGLIERLPLKSHGLHGEGADADIASRCLWQLPG